MKAATPTSTCGEGWGPYISKDMPEWTKEWQAAFTETGLEAIDGKVQGVGETRYSFCGEKTTEEWGAAYYEIQAAILVANTKDHELLGKAMGKVYPAVDRLIQKEKGLAEANLAIRLISKNDRKEIVPVTCRFIPRLELIRQGKSGKELFEATCTGGQ
jgi:hypothetical protein